MKKRYTLYLEVDPTETVQAWLEANGMTFSGFVNSILRELAKELKGQPTDFNKKCSEMTLKEFGETMMYWFGKMEEDEKKFM